MTKIHDSATCTAGFNGRPCEMCQFAEKAAQKHTKSPSETYYGYPRLDTGVKIDSSPSSASGIDVSVPTFDQEWHDAPRWTTRYTERQVAEWWFIRGQHAKEVELVTLLNLDLTEMVRVAQERAER